MTLGMSSIPNRGITLKSTISFWEVWIRMQTRNPMASPRIQGRRQAGGLVKLDRAHHPHSRCCLRRKV